MEENKREFVVGMCLEVSASLRFVSAEKQTTCSRGKQIPESSGKIFGQARIPLVFLSGVKSVQEWREVDASA